MPYNQRYSTIDRYGCIDSDGDGYSDPDASWTVANGSDAFVLDQPSGQTKMVTDMVTMHPEIMRIIAQLCMVLHPWLAY